MISALVKDTGGKWGRERKQLLIIVTVSFKLGRGNERGSRQEIERNEGVRNKRFHAVLFS